MFFSEFVHKNMERPLKIDQLFHQKAADIMTNNLA